MGVGDSLEAEYVLRAPIPAGTWRLVADGIIIESCDIRFEIFWRDADGEHPIVTFEHHFDPPGGLGFEAVPYEETMEGVAVPAIAGDELVLRYSAITAAGSTAYIPNGDGIRYNGRIPFIELPD